MVAFSYFFTMKRVEIQMKESNDTVIQTVAALNKQIKFEKVVMTVYAIIFL